MLATIRPTVALALLPLLAGPILPARADDPMTAARAGDWTKAQTAASDYADPVAGKLVTYYRLLAPSAASPTEITSFLAQNADWPNRGLLLRRRQEAIAKETDDAAVRALRGGDSPPAVTLPAALDRCAVALAAGGEPAAAAADARAAWITGFATPGPEQASFLARWKGALRPEDERARFDHLAWAGSAEATRQVARLAPGHRPAAKARLALQRDAPDAIVLLDKLPEAERREPAMVLGEARWLRHAKRTEAAEVLWKDQGERAERAAPSLHQPAFWAERNAFARELLAQGDPASAYALADDPVQTAAEPAGAAAFLAGFIALRKLHEPDAALAQFRKLLCGKAVITEARAHYWIGRALAAQGKDPKPDYAKAADFPTTFYGQLAARALGEDTQALARRIRALRDPSFSNAEAWGFAGSELVRAAAMLVAWGEFGHARAFLLRAAETAPDAAGETLSARLALAFDMPDTAVLIARRVGVQGRLLPQSGWPEPVHPPPGPPDPAVTLALIRQESSFDAGVTSPAGAQGLMQLLPATAEAEARRAGSPIGDGTLTADPARNMELGTAYLRSLIGAFGESLPMAVAAYNAGPRRVARWIADFGDPRTSGVDMLDWIELIPFDETRNYVERVLENVVVYQSHRDEASQPLVAQWMH